MAIPNAFKYNQDAKYRTNGAYNPTHQFSLVNQEIRVNKKGSFHVRFPNIWADYKLPKVQGKDVIDTYANWLSNQMQFWQNQLNFAVFCATTGCGVSKEHLRHKDPTIRSVFRFHVYYQIRKILNEMQCPIPSEESFKAMNNGINMSAYERICNEFGINSKENFRQKYDNLNGFGSVRYYEIVYHYTHGGMRFTTEKVLRKGNSFTKQNNLPVVRIPPSGKFASGPGHTYNVEYVEQYYDHDPGYADGSSDKSIYAAIGSFVSDKGYGFTQAGVARINDSVRTYVWAILGAQSQARSSILGTGKAFDAQKQFLANVEDAINSEVDLPSSIRRYQSTLQYARSKVDFCIGVNLYMVPSNMDLIIGNINGYNNLIVIASSDLQLGHNDEVNKEQPIAQETFESPLDDFQDTPVAPVAPVATFKPDDELDSPVAPVATFKPDDEFDSPAVAPVASFKEFDSPAVAPGELTHEENKLLLTLGGIAAGTTLIWLVK